VRLLRLLRLGLDRLLETLVAVVMGVLVVDVIWQVFTRYALGKPSSWTEELATYLMIWVGLLGASVALKRGAHLGIDYFVLKLPPRVRVGTEVLVFAVAAVFSVFVLVIGGFKLALDEFDQISPALGLRKGYVYMALPISGFFLTLYSLEFLVNRIVTVFRGKAPAEETDTKAQA
jgi:TRAP-type C4-dicarboxylate transport system permease small subunit